MGHKRHKLSFALMALLPGPAVAQTAATTAVPSTTGTAATTVTAPTLPATTALPTGTVCMRREITNNGGPPFTLQAMIPAEQAQALAAKGYLPSKCGKATIVQLAAYRKMVCTMAIQGNEAVVNRNAEILGERPETLCTHARAIEAKLGIIAPAATLADVPTPVPAVGTANQIAGATPN